MVKILYSPRETNLLLNLIKKYEVAIYNKRTDNRSNQEKDAAWEAVTKKFNASANVTKRTKMQLRKKWENLRTEYKRQLKKGKISKMQMNREQNSGIVDDGEDILITTSPERPEIVNDSGSSTFDTFEEEESCEFNATYATSGFSTSNFDYKNNHDYSELEEMTAPYFPISKVEQQPPAAFRTALTCPEAMSSGKSIEIKRLSSTISLNEFRLRQEEELHELRKKKLLLKIQVLEEELELKKVQRKKVAHNVQKTSGSPEFVDIADVHPQ